MDRESKALKLSGLPISSVEFVSEENSIKSMHSEPEMEEFNEDALVKNLLRELNMDPDFDDILDAFTHKPNTPNAQCFHCNLEKKLAGIKKEINVLNAELNSANEVINVKIQQNLELKNSVMKLEGNLKNSCEVTVLEKKEKGCSCGSGCIIC